MNTDSITDKIKNNYILLTVIGGVLLVGLFLYFRSRREHFQKHQSYSAPKFAPTGATANKLSSTSNQIISKPSSHSKPITYYDGGKHRHRYHGSGSNYGRYWDNWYGWNPYWPYTAPYYYDYEYPIVLNTTPLIVDSTYTQPSQVIVTTPTTQTVPIQTTTPTVQMPLVPEVRSVQQSDLNMPPQIQQMQQNNKYTNMITIGIVTIIILLILVVVFLAIKKNKN